jgi:hypothetical protein
VHQDDVIAVADEKTVWVWLGEDGLVHIVEDDVRYDAGECPSLRYSEVVALCGQFFFAVCLKEVRFVHPFEQTSAFDRTFVKFSRTVPIAFLVVEGKYVRNESVRVKIAFQHPSHLVIVGNLRFLRKSVETLQDNVVIDDVEEFLNVAFGNVNAFPALSADVFLDCLDGIIAVSDGGFAVICPAGTIGQNLLVQIWVEGLG